MSPVTYRALMLTDRGAFSGHWAGMLLRPAGVTHGLNLGDIDEQAGYGLLVI